MVPGGFSGGDAGVKNHWLAQAVDRAATRPPLRLARFGGGRERDGQGFPSRQVPAARVPPIFRPAGVVERIKLVEQMIITLVKNGPVRVIDPLRGSGDVKGRVG